jgi:hypothetical protein
MEFMQTTNAIGMTATDYANDLCDIMDELTELNPWATPEQVRRFALTRLREESTQMMLTSDEFRDFMKEYR